jgi:hypothetical protein
MAAALAFAAKSNALIMLPLIAALGMAHNARTEWRVRDGLERVGRLVGPLALGAALLVGWDMARAPRSFFELGYSRNNPGRLIRADELWPRAERWLHWLGFISGTRVLNVMWLAMLPVHLARHSRTRAAVADWMIAAFGAAFMAWHWLIAFNTYDRYLHPLVPFVILLAARIVSGLSLLHLPTPSPSDGEGKINSERVISSARRGRGFRGWGRLARIALGVLVIGMMIPATAKTLRGEARIGGDQGQHNGIDTLADVLNTQLSGEIVYDHWLGWELAYYLGGHARDHPVFSMPEALADDNQQSSWPAAHRVLSRRRRAGALAGRLNGSYSSLIRIQQFIDPGWKVCLLRSGTLPIVGLGTHHQGAVYSEITQGRIAMAMSQSFLSQQRL